MTDEIKTPPKTPPNSGVSTTPSLEFSEQQTPTPPNVDENAVQEQQQQQWNVSQDLFSPSSREFEL